MPLITWRDVNGNEISARVASGMSLMQAAVSAGVLGISGDCGGALACATCHVVTDLEWSGLLGPPGAAEDELLEVMDARRTPTSLLSCQILAQDDLDGLVLSVPEQVR